MESVKKYEAVCNFEGAAICSVSNQTGQKSKIAPHFLMLSSFTTRLVFLVGGRRIICAELSRPGLRLRLLLGGLRRGFLGGG